MPWALTPAARPARAQAGLSARGLSTGGKKVRPPRPARPRPFRYKLATHLRDFSHQVFTLRSPALRSDMRMNWGWWWHTALVWLFA